MQQELSSPTWIHTAAGLLVSFLAGGGIYKVLDTWLNRKKPAAEIHVQEATATEITVRAASNAGDAIIRFLARLDEAQITIDKLRAERDAWQDQYDEVFVQRDSLMSQNRRLQDENSGYEAQIKRMDLTLKTHRLNYDDTQDKPVQPPK